MAYLLLVVAVVLNASANLLIKVGATELAGPHPARVLANPHLLGGLALFALNVLFYIAALSRLNLSLAYPVMVAGGLLIIVVGSAVWLREAITLLQACGIGFLVIGIALVTWKPGT